MKPLLITILILITLHCNGQTITNLEKATTAWASSSEGSQYLPANAFDGNIATRWASASTNTPQFVATDFGEVSVVTGASILFENAYAPSYTIDRSDDKLTWLPVFLTNSSDGWLDTISGLSFTTRYVRINMTVHACYCPGSSNYSITNATFYGYPLAFAPLPPVITATPSVLGSSLSRGLKLSSPTNNLGQYLMITGVTNLPALTYNMNGSVRTGSTATVVQFTSFSPSNITPKFLFQGWRNNAWQNFGQTNSETSGTWLETAFSGPGVSYFRGVILP